jgi:hypothetical protein
MNVRLLLPLVLSTYLTGCYTHTVSLGGAAPSGKADVKKWHSGLLWGIVELDQYNAKQLCGDKKVQAVGSTMNVLNAIVTGLAFGGVYTATTVKVWCGGDGNASLELPLDSDPRVSSEVSLLVTTEDGRTAIATR